MTAAPPYLQPPPPETGAPGSAPPGQLPAAGGVGHTKIFDGPFDVAMAFFFYVPNLAVAELFIRARQRPFNAVTALPA